MERLKFIVGNSKIAKDTAIFSLPAGWSCPFARDCLSRADKATGKLTDGKHNRFRCYAASGENLFPNIRISRWRNYNALKGKSFSQLVELIQRSLPRNQDIIRIHQSGDFFNQTYFNAWLEVAINNPQKLFYAYTKALPFWVNRIKDIPSNFHLNASKGGTHDILIAKHNLKFVEVVFSETEAKTKKLAIDHDDSLAFKQRKSYAILLHGIQPAGSIAAKAQYQLRIKGKGGYKADYFDYYKKAQ